MHASAVRPGSGVNVTAMQLVFDYTTTAAADLPSEIDALALPCPNAELRRLHELSACYQLFVGHELANQLVPLQAFSRLLLDFHRSELDDECQQLLARIADLAQRIDRHARQLAEFGRLLREPLCGNSLSLADVVGEAVAETKARFARQIDSSLWNVTIQLESVDLARPLLHAVLTHLLSNAVQSLLPDRPGVLTIHCSTDPLGWTLRIADNGRGLHHEQQQLLTEPFAASRQVSSGWKPAGLGFFFVRQAVARWRGRVSVQSTPGQGTIVSLSLPIRMKNTSALDCGARSQT